MGQKVYLLFLWLCCSCAVANEHLSATNSSNFYGRGRTENGEIDVKFYRERLDNQTISFEVGLKKLIKNGVKSFLPTLMRYNDDSPMSSKCTSSLMKYIASLTSVKVWAVKMLDATSKPPSGIFEGTFSDFGAFDSCLEIEVPKRNGDIEFRGQYCAVEAVPFMLPIPKNFSMAKQEYAKPLDTIGVEADIAGTVFNYLKLRFGVCIPSICTLNDMQRLAARITEIIEMDVKIPQCYVKQETKFEAIHIVVIFILCVLLLTCIIGSVIEYQSMQEKPEKLSTAKRILKCFSAISNFNRLVSSSKGSEELKALHGLRAVTMAWVILGHTYVWTNFQLLRRPKIIVSWFNSVEFETVLNAWVAVEPFFFIGGLLTSYAVLNIMSKTKGKISVPVYIFRRYIRLLPPLLLTMGLVFFLPLISSGPFWYERVDPEIKACTKYWWTNIIFISNWMGMKNICVHPTWYLSADFQLHVITIIILFALYRCPKLGLSLITSIIIACNVAVGVLTYMWELPPTIQVSSGNNAKIEETVDVVHMRTFTHAGPYYLGIIVGYLMLRCKGIRFTKMWNYIGWGASTVLCLTSLYGAHRWNIGEPHGPLLTAIYAASHRTTFTMGVAWVTFACVTGNGGLVNKFLSSSIFAPFGRLTFMVYLLHSLVIWVRMASLRERTFYSHYNVLYDYIGNIVLTLMLTVPMYLLLEAPMSNLERLMFSKALPRQEVEEPDGKHQNGHLPGNVVQFAKNFTTIKGDYTLPTTVELKSVKCLDLVQNTADLEEVNGRNAVS